MNLLFSDNGRNNRTTFFLINVMAGIVFYVGPWVIGSLIVGLRILLIDAEIGAEFRGEVFLLLYVAFGIVGLCMVGNNTIRRLHDIGQDDCYTGLIVVPFVNIPFFFYCLLKKGQDTPNEYGDPPR